MARKSGYVRRGGVMRRETSWLAIAEGRDTNAAANSATLSASLNAAALAMRPFTITRTILRWSVRSDQTGALENFGGAIGMAVVSDQSVAIGVTAVPTPFTDLGSDLWFLHGILDGRFQFVSGVGIQAGTGSLEGAVIDSRAQRKVNDDQDVILCTEEDSLTAVGSVIYSAGRMLIKLH